MSDSSVSRRRLFGYAGAAGLGGVAGVVAGRASAANGEAPVAQDVVGRTHSPYGEQQAGIFTPKTMTGELVAFDLAPDTDRAAQLQVSIYIPLGGKNLGRHTEAVERHQAAQADADDLLLKVSKDITDLQRQYAETSPGHAVVCRFLVGREFDTTGKLIGHGRTMPESAIDAYGDSAFYPAWEALRSEPFWPVLDSGMTWSTYSSMYGRGASQ